MLPNQFSEEEVTAIRDILGYLNFSSGNEQPRFEIAWNLLFKALLRQDVPSDRVWSKCDEILTDQLRGLVSSSDAFRHSDRAGFVLRFLYDDLIPAFRQFHRDALFHQSDEFLFNPFFLARLCALIAQDLTAHKQIPAADAQNERVLMAERIIRQANDFLGFRPIPTLEGEKRCEPDPHEWIAVIPLYRGQSGVAEGRYSELIKRTINILKETDTSLLHDAWFDPEKLDELDIDPRAYDFDHPVNRRPNYHFGTWNPHSIDANGYYRRFVIHQIIVDSILARVEQFEDNPQRQITITASLMGKNAPRVIESPTRDDYLNEAAAVLAGTILMGSGITGDRVQAHDSSVTLATLMPHIASYRDRFYDLLIKKVPEPNRSRLEAEIERYYQPFACARHDLNRRLAHKRAEQLVRMNLARLYARIGYFDAAGRQTEIVQVTSARLLCQIDCLITRITFLKEEGRIGEASAILGEIEDLLHRGIDCGALPDPWTLLGFGAQISLFSSIENTVHDHRLDDLINLLNDIFDLYSALMKDAAATGQDDLQRSLSERMRDLADWWDQFGSTEISAVEGFSGQDVWQSAVIVANALKTWYQAGNAAGDIAFWNQHVTKFRSPKAYVLLAEALLNRKDSVSSMALLMHWLSRNEELPLAEGDYSFHSVLFEWIEDLWGEGNPKGSQQSPGTNIPPITQEEYLRRWKLTVKFIERLEANAGRYGDIPHLEIDSFDPPEHGKGQGDERRPSKDSPSKDGQSDPLDFTDEEMFFDGEDFDEIRDEDRQIGIDPTFKAAYEDMSFRDSAEDGNQDDLMGGPGDFNPSEDVLAEETDRINDRLNFIFSTVKLWVFAAGKSPLFAAKQYFQGGLPAPFTEFEKQAGEQISGWLHQADLYKKGLQALLKSASNYHIPRPSGTSESLMEYDRLNGTKEILLDRIVRLLVDVEDAIYFLRAVLYPSDSSAPKKKGAKETIVETLAAMLRSDRKTVKNKWPSLLKILSGKSLLYIPTSRGGQPKQIVQSRITQQIVLRFLEYTPRLGLLEETFQLMKTVQGMDRVTTQRAGVITEFDRIFETLTQNVTRSIADSSTGWEAPSVENGGEDTESTERSQTNDERLVQYLEKTVDILLSCWLSHSRHIRISSVEGITDQIPSPIPNTYWVKTKEFIQRYGSDIFTQEFLVFRNIRAILHQGVGNYLRSLMALYQDGQTLEIGEGLVDALVQNQYPFRQAASCLETVLECIAENFSEYIDYNSTTTHSDHGEKVYMFLDMLRVLTMYERISWNLKPVYWVHQTLIKYGFNNAAALWEERLGQKSVKTSEEILRSYQKLSQQYGISLPSISERLSERFVRPLQIDQMCGLIPEVTQRVRTEGEENESFRQLSNQVEFFANQQAGIGFEPPEWLRILQDEVADTLSLEKSNGERRSEDIFSPKPIFPPKFLTPRELDEQLNWTTKHISFHEP